MEDIHNDFEDMASDVHACIKLIRQSLDELSSKKPYRNGASLGLISIGKKHGNRGQKITLRK